MDYAGSSSPMYDPYGQPRRRPLNAEEDPIRAFKARMAAGGAPQDSVSVEGPRESDVMGFQRELVGGEGMRNENVAITPTTSGSYVDARGNQIGPKAAAFARRGATVIPSRNPNVTIQGNEAMTGDQRVRVANMATKEAGYRAPSTASFNGQDYILERSGPRVSQNKASQFLALDAQERQMTEAKAEKDRQFQAEQIQRQAQADRQTRMDDNVSLDRREARIANRDTRNQQMKRDDYTFGRQQQQDQRADASRLSPQQERELATYQAILSNPNASPRARALATQGMARIGGAPSDVAAELARPSAQENAAPVMDAINNDPIYAGPIAELQRAITRAQDLPWWDDLGDAFKFGLFEPSEADPAEVAAIKSEVERITQAVASQYGLEDSSVRQAILNQILPGITDAAPGVGRQLRGALRSPLPAQRAPASAPAAQDGPAMAARLPGGGPAF